MTQLRGVARQEIEPLDAIARSGQAAALAVICGIEGPSYRPLGACMAVFEDGRTVGSLSSGCIESDIAHHAVEALGTGEPVQVRYGKGSPFMDIKLPCGGGMDVLIVPRPNRLVLQDLVRRHDGRQSCRLTIDTADGALSLDDAGETGPIKGGLAIRFDPALRFLILGAGPEASSFAAIVQSMGFPNIVMSPDRRTLQEAEKAGCRTRHLVGKALPPDIEVDARTAAILFFHDHDWEPPLLVPLLESPAFFVGAQGSRRSAEARLLELEALGVSPEARDRLHGPVGLIPSTRNAYTLAVSVLAEVLSKGSAQPA
jgi:xanthine dehydrogenase accessory factor